MRIIDDEEALEALRQQRYEQRDSLKEDFSKQITVAKRELEVVRANAKKAVAEIKAHSVAEQGDIMATAALKKEIINGDTLITKTRDETIGMTQAEQIEITAKNESNKKIAAKMLEISSLRADTIETIG